MKINILPSDAARHIIAGLLIYNLVVLMYDVGPISMGIIAAILAGYVREHAQNNNEWNPLKWPLESIGDWIYTYVILLYIKFLIG